MSELTFNIADYRPLAEVRTNDRGPVNSGFVVLSSNSAPREYAPAWLNPQPEVIDIRLVRESHRTNSRRGKILRFCNPASHRVYTMPAHGPVMSTDGDPGPMVA